jgi:DNA-binding SARP family transcriptional activator
MMRDLADHVAVRPQSEPRPIVHLFDGPYITVAGRRSEVPEGSKRILAFVALRPGPVERRLAAGALWPIGDDHRAAGNLRSSLWRLRGAGIDVLSADNGSLSLRDGVLVDSHLTLDWANRLIANRTEPGDLAILPDRVEALDLLPGCYDDWAIIERERIRQRMLHALESMSRVLTELGRYADAVEAALTAINAEPLRESAQRVLIEAHGAEGNWVEARAAFCTYRDLVRRELGIEPSEELTAFIHRGQARERRRAVGRRPQIAAVATA